MGFTYYIEYSEQLNVMRVSVEFGVTMFMDYFHKSLEYFTYYNWKLSHLCTTNTCFRSSNVI